MTGLKRTLHDRRGFTLVELVVVLVILGITASFAVPALTGYIDTSKEKKAVSEAQACVMAATRLGAARYAESRQANVNASVGNGSGEDNVLGGWVTSNQTAPTITGDTALTEGTGQYLLHVANAPGGGFPATGDTTVFTKAADVGGTIQTLTLNASGQVVYLVYTSVDGIQVVYTNDGSSTTVKDNDNVVVVPTPKATDDSGGGDNPGGGGDSGGGEKPGGGDTPTVSTLSVTIKKVDYDTNAELSNAVLEIRQNDTVLHTITSSSAGNSPVNLPAGNYVLHEVSAPAGYNLSPDIPFSVIENNSKLLLSGGTSVDNVQNIITMSDQKKTLNLPTFGDLKFTIADSYDHNSKLSGVKFKLVRLDHSDEFGTVACTIAEDLTTDDTGTISIPVYNPASLYFKDHPEDSNHAVADSCMYQLIPISWPTDRQEVFYIQFQIVYVDKQYTYNETTKKNEITIKDYSINAKFSTNDSNDNYGPHEVDSTDPHHLTYFNKAVPYLTINLVDKSTKESLTGAAFHFNIVGNSGALDSVTSLPTKIALRIHGGDNIPPKTPTLNEYDTFIIQETGSPLGYALMPNVQLQISRSGLTSPQINNCNDSSLYAEVVSPFVLNLYNLPSAPVTIRKIDDKNNILKQAGFSLASSDGGVIDSNGNVVKNYTISHDNFAGETLLRLMPGNYVLTETQTPPNFWVGSTEHSYTKASPISFTIEKGSTENLVVMVDHDTKEDSSTFVIGNFTFTNCQNWSHKLTTDANIKFNSEFVYWKGSLYWSYRKYQEKESATDTAYKNVVGIANPKMSTYSKDDDALSAAPDPVTFLQEYLDVKNRKCEYSKADDYIIRFTGNQRYSTTPANDFMRGDLILISNATGTEKTLYVYVGEDNKLSSVPNSPQDVRKNYSSLFFEIPNNYTIS